MRQVVCQPKSSKYSDVGEILVVQTYLMTGMERENSGGDGQIQKAPSLPKSRRPSDDGIKSFSEHRQEPRPP